VPLIVSIVRTGIVSPINVEPTVVIKFSLKRRLMFSNGKKIPLKSAGNTP